MKKTEQIISKINNKTIKLEDIVDLDLTEQEFNIVMEALKKSGVDVQESFDELQLDNEKQYSNDIIKQYFEEIGKIPTLSKEEEKELFSQYALTKDPKIREKLIKSNLKLVVSVAKHYYYKTKINAADFLDLIQDGNEGLLKAIEKYDVTLGFKFSTYASWWIRQGITRALFSNYKTVRIPVHMADFVNKITKYVNEENIMFGEKPCVEELAEYFNVSEEKINLALEIIYNTPVSLEARVSEESNTTILDYMKDESVNVEKEYIEKQIYKDLRETMKNMLKPREYFVVSCRFGIVNEVNDCPTPMTLEQIAAKIGVTRERVRQIEAKALRVMRIKETGNKIKSLKNS